MPNRKKTLLLSAYLAASALAPVWAENAEQFDMTADSFDYSSDGQTVKAHGNVKILSKEGSIWADEISYSKETETLQATGNVIYVDANNVTMFVDSLELSDGMKKGILENIYMNMREGDMTPRLAAEKAERIDANNMSLSNVAYSPCALCNSTKDEDLPWKIRAGTVHYNDEKGHITYEDAYLDIYGTSTMYLPWFRHPVKEVAVNGLLPPRFGSSTKNGFEISNAYYHRFAPNLDTTTRVNYFSKRGAQIQPELRYQGENLYTELRASVIDDDKTERSRSHFESKTEYVAKEGHRYGLVGEIASDDEYLDDFYERTDAYLRMQAYAEDASENHYAAFSASRYQDLREQATDEHVPHTLPRFEYERVFQLDGDSSDYIMVNTDFSALTRSEGTTMQRLAARTSYHKAVHTDSGNRFTFEASLRADIYNVDAEETNSVSSDGVESRLLPQMSLLWDRSYISPDGHHKITPKAMLVVSPLGSNPKGTPNEDSLDYELDTNSLFTTNRFSGYDRVESGSRFIYGLDNHWGSPTDINWRLFLGQSLRLNSDATIEAATNDTRKQSDFVGFFEGSPTDWLTFRSNFLLDQSTFEAERMDNTITIGDLKASYIDATHTFVEDGPEELHVEGRYMLDDTWALEGELRKDLEDEGRTLLTSGSIVYNEQCYRISFRAQRRGYESTDVEPATEYTINVELLTFGSD